MTTGGKYAGRPAGGKEQSATTAILCVALLGALLGMSGCGYTLRHRLMESFTRPEGIFVPVFSNLTDETGAERVFTDALIRELQSRGEVIITTRDRGGLELRGTVRSISYGPSSPSSLTSPYLGLGLQWYRRLPTEIGITVVLSLELLDPGPIPKVVWAKDFSAWRRVDAPTNRTYNWQAPSALGPYTQSLIESQYSEIARIIMRDVYDEMVELF